MFECLRRRHRHLRTWVLGLFAALWLVALSSAAPTRMVLPLLANGGRPASAWPRWGFAACPRRPTNGPPGWGRPRCRPTQHPQRPLPCLFAVHCPGRPPGSAHQRLPPAPAGGLAPAWATPAQHPRAGLAQAPLPARGPPQAARSKILALMRPGPWRAAVLCAARRGASGAACWRPLFSPCSLPHAPTRQGGAWSYLL